MEKTQYLYGFLLLFVSLFACRQDSRARFCLEEAERLMESRPDSSLSLLESVRSPEKLPSEDYATWCLLLTQARDKNYVEHTSDSVIDVAVRYFEQQKDPLRFAQALYYKGRVREDQGELEEATEFFVKALDVGRDSRDYRLLFLASSQLGTLYGHLDMQELTLKSYQKSCQYAIQLGDSSCLSYAYSYIGRAYGVQEDWKKSIESYKKGEEIALAIHDESALLLSLSESAGIYRRAGFLEKARNCYMRMNDILQDKELKYKTRIYLGLGNLYRYTEQYDSAALYLQKALSCDNPYTKQSVYQSLYYLYEEQQDYKKAVEYNNLYWANVDSLNQATSEEKILAIEARYNYEKLEKENLRVKGERRQRTISLVATFLFLLLSISHCLSAAVIEKGERNFAD